MGESHERQEASVGDGLEPCGVDEASPCKKTAMGAGTHVGTGHVPALQAQSSPNGDAATTTDTRSPSNDHDSSSGVDDRADAATDKRQPMRNISRERKRAELAALRDEADALERQRNLLLLKRKHQVELAPPIHVVDQWKRAAESERVTRERAESENERLAAMLRQQIGLSSVLECLLRKRLRRSESEEEDVSPQTAPVGSTRKHDTSLGMLHAQFSRDIQRIYRAGIGRIFIGHDWAPASAELGRSIVREDKIDETTNTPMVELRETRHVPFEYQRVADAMWRCALQPFVEHGRLIESYETAEDQIAFKYRAATPGNKDRGDLLTAVMVLQKFEEADRTVQVWRLMSSSTEERSSQRAFSDETGWFIIEPVPPGIPGIEAGTAIVRIVSQLVPLWTPNLAPNDGQLSSDDFHELVVEASCEDMVALGDAVGSLLLDESLGLTSDVQPL